MSQGEWGSAAAGLAFDIISRGATVSKAYRRMGAIDVHPDVH